MQLNNNIAHSGSGDKIMVPYPELRGGELYSQKGCERLAREVFMRLLLYTSQKKDEL